ncbi:hypothetical protein H5P28_12295 [Ruficoccus amylovorans]|uniref:Flagellin N-terminal domain-containing protein n=1 Tax=Ruficoccus amylovorans TaxID=1804625 RepID=A0A842HFJ4_9BACT|nr:hypothetical protein [Ruficoccus amylovorans]MBC2595039.1 hypothetical protein [Ruficoccus amylovorans]
MDSLSSTQIADFLNPLAFARTRENRVGQSKLGEETGTIRSPDIEASYRLVTGASTRLETLEGNLFTMLELAGKGASARTERARQDIYGQLRSLGAGFDQVVEAIRFNDRAVFTGDPISLSLGEGFSDIQLNPDKLLTYGEDSLNLSQTRVGAEVAVSYGLEDAIVNQAYDIVGLDIESAAFLPGGNPALELESGAYKLGITYQGANSSVELRDLEGNLIEKQDGVDLSGDGREWVDFDAGIRLSFEKFNLFATYDKYDYERNGPAKLSATLNYRRIDEYILRTGDEPPEDSVTMSFPGRIRIGSTSLEALAPHMNPIATGVTAAEGGRYTVEVDYNGAQSRVRLKDELGRLQRYLFDVDLSAEGTTEVDFGNGLAFDWKNTGFGDQKASLTAFLDYRLAKPPVEEFDFKAYADQLADAIEIIQAQREMIDTAKAQIEQSYSSRNSGGAGGQVLPLNLSGISTILGGASADSFFASTTSQARLGVISDQIFSAASAFAVQRGLDESTLAQLENSAANGRWFASG